MDKYQITKIHNIQIILDGEVVYSIDNPKRFDENLNEIKDQEEED